MTIPQLSHVPKETYQAPSIARRRLTVQDHGMQIAAQNSIDPRIAADIVAAIGLSNFGKCLDTALRKIVPFDLTAIFGYPIVAQPDLLHNGLGDVSPPEVMQVYVGGTYLLDAVYTACMRKVPEGLYRLSDLAPDEFFQGDYFNSAQVHPCISLETGALAEEICFLVPLPQGYYASYSLMRSNGKSAFNSHEFHILAAYAPLVSAAVIRQWGQLHPVENALNVSAEEPVESAFRTFARDTLSPREQAIVSLVLRGHSSTSIGLVLGIAEGTVKNHRKHIHFKLGISSQAELFALFLRHLEARRMAFT